MIRGIHHVSITAQNFERMLEFYRDALGFETVFEASWADSEDMDLLVGLKGSVADVVMLNAGNVMLELFRYKSPAGKYEPRRPVSNPGYTHICFDVEDIDTEIEKLTKAGVTLHRTLLDVPDARVRTVYGRDPDGNVVEIQEVFGDDNAIKLRPALRKS